MKNRFFFFVTSLALFFVAQSDSNAGLVITAVAAPVADVPASPTQTVIVNVYGGFVSAAPGDLAPQNVSTFGLRLTVNTVAPTILSAAFAPNTSQWFDKLVVKPAPTISG